MFEQPRPDVRNQRRGQFGVPALVPDRNDRGDDAGDRQNRENLDQRLEVFLAERVVDEEFETERHDDIVLLVVVEPKLVIVFFIIVIVGRRRRRLVADDGTRGLRIRQQLCVGFRRESILRDGLDPIIRR